jgi:hypothetical protein
MQYLYHFSGGCRNTQICCTDSLFSTEHSSLPITPAHSLAGQSLCARAHCRIWNTCLSSSFGHFFARNFLYLFWRRYQSTDDSHTFGVYISCNSAYVICLSFVTACMIELRCRQVKIHVLPQYGLYSRDWWSVAGATNFRTVDQGHPVIRLTAAKEYLK